MVHIIEFIIYPGAMGLDITGPLEVFHTATAVLRQNSVNKEGYQAQFVAARKGPVRLSSGLEIVAQANFNKPTPADILLVPGGDGIDDLLAEGTIIKYLRQRSKQVKRIVSVCKGSFLLAATGMLNDKSATTHWMTADDLAKNYPAVNVKSEAIFTRDGNIYTSAGVTTGIDLALHIVEEDFGSAVAMETARLLVIYYRRPGSQSQFSSPLKAQERAGSRFAQLHQWLIKNLHHPINVEQMASRANMSARNFARVFKAETGLTPNKYLEMLRLDLAKEMISTGGNSLENIATESGFGREERLRRAFIRQFGVTPSQYRQHFLKQ